MKKLRLMLITHDLAIGGLQQVVVNICKSIDRSQFDVSVLCLRSLGDFVPEVESMGIEVLSLPPTKSGTDYWSFLKVGKILREKKIDIIHTHNTQPLFDGTMGAMISGSVKTIVHTDHARGAPGARRWVFIEWLMSKFVYKYVAVSDDTARERMKYEKISEQKMFTIMNGIDGSKYNIDIDEKKLRNELGVPPEGSVIGLGVRLAEQKGIRYLLQAMPEVIKNFPDITLVIAGRGPLADDLKKQANDIGIHPNVRFIGPRLDIPALLKLFDLYVLPSLWEGLPMVLLEAMAAGCPIIATDVGGVSMAIHDGENGKLIEPGNIDQLSQAIIDLLSNKALREQYSLKGINTFKSEFSAAIMTRQYEKLYLREPLHNA